jgi:hypothetical protein
MGYGGLLLRKVIFTLIILISFKYAFAQEAEDDLYLFKQALKISKISQNELNKYLSPYEGPLVFRLGQGEAPWAGNYFSMKSGGIANRWRTNSYPIEIYDKQSVLKLTSEQMYNLSPVEKYDLLLGRYDFRATQHEINNRGPGRDPFPDYWEGFCNGIRCAGLITEEPISNITLKNKDGIQIEFSPADIKALLGASYYYVEKYAQIGAPSMSSKAETPPNPAVFDLALRYFLAINKKGFVIDSNLGPEIWNETVVGYKRKISLALKLTGDEKQKYPSAISKIQINVVLDTLGEIDIKETDNSTKQKVADGSLLSNLETSYFLYLDVNGNAIDGKWLHGTSLRGVDFAWFASGKGTDHLNTEEGGNPYLRFDFISKLAHRSAKLICAQILIK